MFKRKKLEFAQMEAVTQEALAQAYLADQQALSTMFELRRQVAYDSIACAVEDQAEDMEAYAVDYMCRLLPELDAEEAALYVKPMFAKIIGVGKSGNRKI